MPLDLKTLREDMEARTWLEMNAEDGAELLALADRAQRDEAALREIEPMIYAHFPNGIPCGPNRPTLVVNILLYVRKALEEKGDGRA